MNYTVKTCVKKEGGLGAGVQLSWQSARLEGLQFVPQHTPAQRHTLVIWCWGERKIIFDT